jgi:hypothetical protein
LGKGSQNETKQLNAKTEIPQSRHVKYVERAHPEPVSASHFLLYFCE